MAEDDRPTHCTSRSSWWTIDEPGDRQRASDGASRFGAYLAERIGLAIIDEEVLDAVSWTSWCWRVATSPVMSPGYVELDEVLDGTALRRDPYNGRLAAAVQVRAPLAVPLRGWRSWERQPSGRLTQPATAGPVALTVVTLEAPLRLPPGHHVTLPERWSDPAELTAEAKRTVRDIVVALETAFGDAVERVASGRPAPTVTPRSLGGLA